MKTRRTQTRIYPTKIFQILGFASAMLILATILFFWLVLLKRIAYSWKIYEYILFGIILAVIIYSIVLACKRERIMTAEDAGFFKAFKKGFLNLGEIIVTMVNFILLLVVYIIGVGITALIARITGKHFLELKKPEHIKTYWKEYGLKKEPKERYYRQF